jgi:hypothetical protein
MIIKPLDTGKIVIIVVFFLFYLRLFMLRGRKLKQERAALAKKLKSGGKNKDPQLEQSNTRFRPRYAITSWWIIAPGVALMLIGLAINTTTWFPALIQPYDWVFIAMGGVLFIFGIK